MTQVDNKNYRNYVSLDKKFLINVKTSLSIFRSNHPCDIYNFFIIKLASIMTSNVNRSQDTPLCITILFKTQFINFEELEINQFANLESQSSIIKNSFNYLSHAINRKNADSFRLQALLCDYCRSLWEQIDIFHN